MGARADVLGCVSVLAEGLRRRVVQEAEDVAARPALAEVAVAEEGWRLDLEADAEEVVYLQGEVVAEFICGGLAFWSYGGSSQHTEVTILAFILSHALWDRLLRLAILEGAEIEGPGFCGLPSVTGIRCRNTSRVLSEGTLLL